MGLARLSPLLGETEEYAAGFGGVHKFAWIGKNGRELNGLRAATVTYRIGR